MKFSLKDQLLSKTVRNSESFLPYIEKMGQSFDEAKIKDKDYYELNDKALRGDAEAVSYFYQELERYVRRNPFSGTVPPAYSTLTEGLFHEWKGFASAYPWITNRQYNNSSGLQIIGENIFYTHNGRFVPYPHKMSSLQRVEQLKRTLLSADDRAKADRDKPAEEFKINDPLWPGRFIRIALWVYPRTWEDFTTISMRRQIVEYLTYEEQAGTLSIPKQTIPLWHAISRLKLNTIVGGPVGSGKTTFANTYVGEQIKKASHSLGVVMIERHPESTLPYVISGHRIIPVQALHEELMTVGIEALRMDPDVLFMTEMRHNEWEFYIWAGSKGYDNIVGSFHTIDSEDIPYQGALAVYTMVGGSLKGHLMSALQSCKLVIIMAKLPNGEKRVTRISEIVYDELNNDIYANDWMRWNKITDTYSYNSAISESLRNKLMDQDPHATEEFLKVLTALEEKAPMRNPHVISERSRKVLND